METDAFESVNEPLEGPVLADVDMIKAGHDIPSILIGLCMEKMYIIYILIQFQ